MNLASVIGYERGETSATAKAIIAATKKQVMSILWRLFFFSSIKRSMLKLRIIYACPSIAISIFPSSTRLNAAIDRQSSIDSGIRRAIMKD